MNDKAPLTEMRIVRTYLSRPPHPYAKVLTAVILCVFAIISRWAWADPKIFDAFIATKALVFEQFEVWRLLTSMFIHGDAGHLFSNLFMLAILGYLAFGYFGFWVFPIASLSFATIIQAISIWTYPAKTGLIGSSGLVYFLAGFWLMMFLLIERQRTIAARLLRVIGVGLLILFPQAFDPQVSHRTHFIAVVVGVLFATAYFYRHRQKLRHHEVIEEEKDLNPTEPKH